MCPDFCKTSARPFTSCFTYAPRGNRDYAGWKWVGYPGPRHSEAGYSPAQMIGKAPIHPIWEER